ncbi:hypothetical protein [Catenovulum sediminis]|nr:hypothetical protein [Catenovulum sediminis]
MAQVIALPTCNKNRIQQLAAVTTVFCVNKRKAPKKPTPPTPPFGGDAA